MTDPNYTAMLLVIDRSGSIAGIRDDMVGGLTTMLAEQSAEPGLLTVDIVTFDDVIETQCSLADPNSITIQLDPRGSTALFDAIGTSVHDFGRVLAELPEHARPETVQVVVVTDGEENASREFGLEAVHALVTQQKNQYSWDFMFLGANQDAVLSGERLGFDADSSMTYAASPDAVASMSTSVGRYVTDVRSKQKRGFADGERAGSVAADAAPAAAKTSARKAAALKTVSPKKAAPRTSAPKAAAPKAAGAKTAPPKATAKSTAPKSTSKKAKGAQS